MARLRLHPLALMVPLTLLALGNGEDAAALIVALLFHEGGHLMAARCLGVGVSRLSLTPFGGAITMENPYAVSPGRLLAVAAAGPAGNALALLIGAALAHWRVLSPALALALLRVNLTLMLFNLLPALPLDGGRMLCALLSLRLDRARAATVGLWLGRATALLLLVAAAALARATGRFNLSFAFAAVFILACAADEREALVRARLSTLLEEMKPLNKPTPVRVVAVDEGCALQEALRAARHDAVTLYAVYKGSRLSSITDDRRLLEAALRQGGGQRVGAALTARSPLPGSGS